MKTVISFVVAVFILSAPLRASDVSSLIKDLGDKDKAKDASKELAKIGKPAVSELIKACEGKDKNRKRYATRAFSRMGQDAEDAIPVLTVLINSKDSQTREYAVEALGNMSKQRDSVLPFLMTAAEKDSDKDVRKAANRAVKKISALVAQTEEQNAFKPASQAELDSQNQKANSFKEYEIFDSVSKGDSNKVKAILVAKPSLVNAKDNDGNIAHGQETIAAEEKNSPSKERVEEPKKKVKGDIVKCCG